MSKKLLALLLALAMVVSMITIPVSATETENVPQETTENVPEETTEETPDETESTESDHVHCVCGGAPTATAANHVCADVTWTPISEALAEAGLTAETVNFSKIKAGNYYLDVDLVVTAANGGKIPANLGICLNGHKIDNDDDGTKLGADSSGGSHSIFGYGLKNTTVTFTDCSYDADAKTWDGTVYGGDYQYGGIAYLCEKSVLNIYGGNFTGKNDVDHKTGGLFVAAQDGSADKHSDPNYASTINIYNGNLHGAKASNSAGLIAVFHCSKLNVYGGTLADGSAPSGGLISCSSTNADAIHIYGGTLTNGSATGGGGLIYISQASGLHIHGGTLSNGSAKNGGLIMLGGVGTITINGGLLTGSSATSMGGAVYMTRGTMYIKGGTIVGNSAAYGGAVAAYANVQDEDGTRYSVNVYVEGGEFYTDEGYDAATTNHATTSGGHFYMRGVYGGATLHVKPGADISWGYTEGADNASDMAGGNIHCYDGIVNMTGGTVSNGKSFSGGNIAFKGSTGYAQASTMSGGTVTEGKALCAKYTTSGPYPMGGNIYISTNEKFTLSGGTISNGTASHAGGNMVIYNNAEVIINNGTISGGLAAHGGSIAMDNNANVRMTVAGGTITGGTLDRSVVKNGTGPCIRLQANARLTLKNQPVIDEVFFVGTATKIDATALKTLSAPIAITGNNNGAFATVAADMSDSFVNTKGAIRYQEGTEDASGTLYLDPTGSATNPIVVNNANDLTSVTAPANGSTYYAINGNLSGYVLTIVEQEGLSVEVEGAALTASNGLFVTTLDGVPTIRLVVTNSTDAAIETVAAIETAVGTESNPIVISVPQELTGVEAKAGTSTYYAISSMLNGMLLTVAEKEGMTVTLNGVVLEANEEGLFQAELNGSRANQLIITAGESDVAAVAAIEAPLGSMDNPYQITVLDDTVSATVAPGETIYVVIAGMLSGNDVVIAADNTTSAVLNGIELTVNDEIFIATMNGRKVNQLTITNNGEEEAFYYVRLQEPAGTQSNPIFLEAGENAITVPAGATLYYTGRFGGQNMVAIGEGLTMVHNDQTYTLTESGVSLVCVQQDFYNPCIFVVTNNTEEAISGALNIVIPEGTWENPAELELGEAKINITDGAYYYEWTAPADGVFTLTINEGRTNWSYALSNEDAGIYGNTYNSATEDWDGTPLTPNFSDSIYANAGDVILITIGTENGGAGTVKFATSFKANDYTVKFARLNLDNEINMQFAFAKNTDVDVTGAYAEVVKDYVGYESVTQIIEAKDWMAVDIDGVTHYVVSFSGIAAKEMGDAIHVTVYNAQGEIVSNVWNDSIKAYIMRNIDSVTEEEQKLYVDMLYYGAAAQTFFSYDVENLVTVDLTDEQKALASTSVVTENNQVPGNNFLGTRLTLVSRIELQMAFENIDNTMRAEYSFVDHYGQQVTGTVNGSEFMTDDTTPGMIVVVNKQVLADAREEVTVNVYNAEGELVASATDSVESYVNRNADNPNMKAEEKDLHQKIMRFANSAYEYFH